MSPSVMHSWHRQAVEALAYVHANGIIHSDIRLGNSLVDESKDYPRNLNLRLRDFGGSYCEKLGVDGKGFPSPPFWHPLVGTEPTPAPDIFGLGTALYSIEVGQWPFLDTPGRPRERAVREGCEADV